MQALRRSTASFSDERLDFQGTQVIRLKQIAEGGFAFIDLCKGVTDGHRYALKRILCHDDVQLSIAKREASVLSSLQPHPNIVKLYGMIEYSSPTRVFMLLDYCDGESVFAHLTQRQGSLEEEVLYSVMRDTCCALKHMHSMKPPIQHRDIKTENILRCSDGRYVVCDFGSCSTEEVQVKDLSRKELSDLEDVIDRYTTFTYRPPEMVDLYRGQVISVQVDMWMLGCVLFIMMNNKIPFSPESKLGILSAKFHVSDASWNLYPKKWFEVLFWLLSVNPGDRPSSAELSSILDGAKWNVAASVECSVTARMRLEAEAKHRTKQEPERTRSSKVSHTLRQGHSGKDTANLLDMESSPSDKAWDADFRSSRSSKTSQDAQKGTGKSADAPKPAPVVQTVDLLDLWPDS